MAVVLINLVVILCFVTALWLVSLWLRDASIIDPFWGTGFVILAWLTWWQRDSHHPSDGLIVLLVTIWGLRLSAYLLWRNAGHGEDRRYGAMRERHREDFARWSLGRVFLLQGTLMWIIAMPIMVGQWSASIQPLQSPIGMAGLLLYAVGLFFETIGDWQLAHFKSQPQNRGKVMDRGLWRYTRHPNYFGDFCVWWGFYLLAVPQGAWWTAFAPALMSFFLLRVSGVTLLERDIHERRPDYRRYQQATS